MKIQFKIIIAVLLLAIAIAAFYFYKENNSSKGFILETEKPGIGDIIQTITATGRLQPIDQVEIGTEVSGTVSQIFTDFNQRVKKGQVLLQIDPLRAKVKVEQTKAAFKSAENEAMYQKRNFERAKELFQKGSLAAAELETAEYRYENARNSMVSAQSNWEQAVLDLANCTIKSPIDGIVLDRAVEAGQTVAASLSAPTLFTLARDLTQMEVKADVDEADIGMVSAEQRVEFSVDAFPGDKFSGEVQEVRLSPNIASNVVTYTVIIKAENPKQKLLPGMTANCNIIVEESLQVLTISSKALQFRPNENTPGYAPPTDGEEKPKKQGGGPPGGKAKRENRGRVWVAGADGILSPKSVETGVSDGARVQIVNGLDTNSSVAIGVQSTETAKNTPAATSPFMPQRGNTKSGGGGVPRMR
jgi:HlyD family secretion protein